MFRNIAQFLKPDGEVSLEVDVHGAPTSHEVQVGTVAVMVAAAQSSEGLGAEELMRLTSSLFNEFGLRDDESGDLFAVAEFLMKTPEKLDSLIQAVVSNFSAEQRERVLSLAWRVFLADSHLCAKEGAFAAQLRMKLGLSMEQALRAQQAASQHTAFTPLQDQSLSTEEES